MSGDPLNMTPDEEKFYQRSVDTTTSEIMSYARLLNSAREAKNSGDLQTAKAMSMALSVMLNSKDKSALLISLTVAVGIITDLANAMATSMAGEAISELEKMLREAKP